MAPNALQGLLKALADPEADPNLRRRALRAYGLFLLGLKGGLLLLLAPFLPPAPYPPLLLLAVALFFAGISTKLDSDRLRATLLVVGWFVFLGTVAWVATFPVSFAV